MYYKICNYAVDGARTFGSLLIIVGNMLIVYPKSMTFIHKKREGGGDINRHLIADDQRLLAWAELGSFSLM